MGDVLPVSPNLGWELRRALFNMYQFDYMQQGNDQIAVKTQEKNERKSSSQKVVCNETLDKSIQGIKIQTIDKGDFQARAHIATCIVVC